MDFHFDGLDEPVTLPDEILTVGQYKRILRNEYARQGSEELTLEVDYLHETVAAILNDPGFVARVDELPMTRRNAEQWDAVHQHVLKLYENCGKTGDDVTNEEVNGGSEEAPLAGPTPTDQELQAELAQTDGK